MGNPEHQNYSGLMFLKVMYKIFSNLVTVDENGNKIYNIRNSR